MLKQFEYMSWSKQIFMGFYESHLHHSDSVYDMVCCEPNPPTGYYYDICDYDGFEKSVTEYACKLIWSEIPDEDEIVKRFEFAGISSPRFYNFSNDKLVASVEVDYDKLKEFCLKTNRKEFDEYLHENFTSYDGFTSFVANNVNQFELESEYEKYDQVMLEFYLLSLDYMKEHDYEWSEYESDLVEYAQQELWNRLCLEKDGKYYEYRLSDDESECIVGEEIRDENS